MMMVCCAFAQKTNLRGGMVKTEAEQLITTSIHTIFELEDSVFRKINKGVITSPEEKYEFTILCNPNLRGGSCKEIDPITRFWPSNVNATEEVAYLVLQQKHFLIRAILERLYDAFPDAYIRRIGTKYCCPYYQFTLS